MRVLIVEADPSIGRDLASGLRAAGYNSEDYSAIVLDLGLPVIDDLTILKSWRSKRNSSPMLVLTARRTWAKHVDSIDAGADDYSPKPFRIEEVLARVRSIIRRPAGHASAVQVGNVVLEERQIRIAICGTPDQLLQLEARLACYQIISEGRMIRMMLAMELIENTYGLDDAHESNAREVLIGRLRKKSGSDLIETRRGFCYLVPSL